MKIVRRVLVLALWVCLLLPFFAAAPAAHPATDDFTFAAYTHATWIETGSLPHVIKDALSYTLRTWRDWQGTMTGVLIMALNPAVFSLEHYWVHAPVLLLFNLGAWFIFLRHVMKRRMGLGNEAFVPVYLALSAALLAFLPDMVEGIYWFNGAWFYMGAQAAALIALVLCDRFAETKLTGAKKKLFAALCCIVLFALGMDNYITAMMALAALMMMALQRLWAGHKEPGESVVGVQLGEEWQEHTFGGWDAALAQRRAAKRTALMMLPIALGLALSVLAPGNAVRMAADGAHESGLDYLLVSVVNTLTAAGGYFLRFMARTPLILILWALTPCLCRAMEKIPVRREYRTPPVILTAASAYLILCAMIIPHMYASGYAGSGRVVNMYHCYVLIAVPVVWMMMLLRMKPETRGYIAGDLAPRAIGLMAAAAALAVCLASGQHGNYIKLIRDWRGGAQDAYIAQFKNEYALCEAAGETEDVYLPAWSVQTVTGKPTAFEDPAMWTNESMATYFGVKSVRVSEAPAAQEAVTQSEEPAQELAEASNEAAAQTAAEETKAE